MNHVPDYVAQRLKVFLCRSAKLVHVEVRPRERVLARRVRRVETARALVCDEFLRGKSALVVHIARNHTLTYHPITLTYNPSYVAQFELVEAGNMRSVGLPPRLTKLAYNFLQELGARLQHL